MAGRRAEPGITYYRMNCDHTTNKKVRLLFNEFGETGYWIWQCILGYAYRTKGYFFDTTDRDELELFATDVCRKQVAVVDEVVAGCLRRSLFDQGVFQAFGVLSSEMMQDTYLEATAERRRKGTKVEMIEEFLLLPSGESKRWENVDITHLDPIDPRKNTIDPRKNGNDPPQNAQSRVKKSRVKKSREETGVSPPSPDEVAFKKFQNWIDAHAPNVAKLKEPFTLAEFLEIRDKYSSEAVRELLKAMHNWKPLLTKNVSAYLTLDKWQKKDEKQKPQNEPGNKAVEKIQQDLARVNNAARQDSSTGA